MSAGSDTVGAAVAAIDDVAGAGGDPVVWVRGLTKRYGEVVAADDVTFDLHAGEILGLLGPNGAGKTTVLECVEGLRIPDAGGVSVGGYHPFRQYRSARNVMGVQLQSAALPETMTPVEAMSLLCAYHGVERRLDLLDRYGLGEKRAARYATLSTGQKRRLSLALATAHDPPVVFLDEPTAGLDVASRADLHGVMAELRRGGAAIVLATHDMAEAEKMCDRIAILLGGRIVAEGTPREITATGSATTRVIVRTERGTFTRRPVTLARSELVSRTTEYAEYLSGDAAVTLADLLEALSGGDDTIVDLRVERPSLEERFLELTRPGGDG